MLGFRLALLTFGLGSAYSSGAAVPTVLSVAGSDSGGGAGIQADLKTYEALGAFGTTAIVAITAQNTMGVRAAEAMTPQLVKQQMDSVLLDMGAHAVKTGMLPTVEIIKTVAASLHKHGIAVRVIDPVVVSAAGHVLIDSEAIAALRTQLIPNATLLTPNMPEAGILLDQPPPKTVEEMREAATALMELGANAVLLKGGRLVDGDMVDVYIDRESVDGSGGYRIVELRNDRVDTRNTHGTGCTLAAAIAAELAKQAVLTDDLDVLAAVRTARSYLSSVFAASLTIKIGKGAVGPLNHQRAAWGNAASSPNGRTFSRELWADPQVKALADRSLNNGFVRALADGSLPKDRFAGYVAQDKFFLEVFSQAYTLALAKLQDDDTQGIKAFASLVKGVLDELKLHGSYAAKWGVDMTSIQPTPECSAYVEFLKQVATERDVAACAAAMVPCMRLYAFLGQQLRAASSMPGAPSAGPYQEWIDTYADPGFEELALALENLLDKYAQGVLTERRGELRDLYVKAMNLELDFFDGWNPLRMAGKDEV